MLHVSSKNKLYKQNWANTKEYTFYTSFKQSVPIWVKLIYYVTKSAHYVHLERG